MLKKFLNKILAYTLAFSVVLNIPVITFANTHETNVMQIEEETLIGDEKSTGNNIDFSFEDSLRKDMLKSPNGTNTVSRTKKCGKLATVTLTATFHWWKDKNGRHVECTSANATYSTTDSHVEKKYLETEKKNDSYAIGKASAIVKYHFYRSDNPFAYVQESFKITCTDDGTIKDNIG